MSNPDEIYRKLRLPMRLSMLCSAEKEDLKAWRRGSHRKQDVPLTDCTSFKPDEVEPVHLALEGEDAESGTHRMAQWLMAKADGVLYVAFKGTTIIKYTLRDTQLHGAGVNDELEEILARCTEERNNVQRVVFTGHSLGGSYAIAALLKLFGRRDSSWLPCEAITFGASLEHGRGRSAPLPANVPPILNVVANYDIVPHLLAMTDGQVNSFMKHVLANGSLEEGKVVRCLLLCPFGLPSMCCCFRWFASGWDAGDGPRALAVRTHQHLYVDCLYFTSMVGFTRVVGSKRPAPDGATVDDIEYSHTGPPITETREIAAREGMVIHAAEVSGQMWNDNGRHASCDVKLCRAAGSTRDKVVIKSKTTRDCFAGETKLLWTATVTFVPQVTRRPSPSPPSPLPSGSGAKSPQDNESDNSGGNIRESTNADFYTKLRLSMRLSMLCYAEEEVLTAWRKGSHTHRKQEVPLTDCTSFKPDEVEPVHLALEGEDAESETHRMARWLMAKADGVLYVAFRGTSTLKDALLEAQLRSIKLDSGVRMHSGFNTGVNDEVKVILAKCKEERSNVQRVVLTGHSLGGAYAIAALLKLFGGRDLPPLAFEAITFGAPLVAVSPTLGGSAELPPDVPPILNVVANYDIVPHLLAMTDGQVDSFSTHIPDLITNGSWLKGLPVELPEAKRFTQELHDLRRRYRPAGTFVFAQSHVEGRMRRTSATVVPSDDAAGILKQFPDVKRLAFAKACVAEHSPTGYWRIVKALCEGKDQVFASCVEKPSKGLSGADERPCDWNFQERAIVNWLDKKITVVTEQLCSFDVASEGEVDVRTLGIDTKITVSSTLFGETKWNIDVPSGGLLIHESHVLGYVARTYSVTDDGWEMGPVVSPHDAHGGHVDQLAALLNRRYPEGTTVGCVSAEPC